MTGVKQLPPYVMQSEKEWNICKQIAGNLVNESGNVPRRGVVPKFSDLEVVALNMASEAAPY